MTKEESYLAKTISIKSMIINLFLFAFKGICGLLISSSSLISDAIHSLTDIISTLIVLIGLKVSNKPADKNHPYGHEKIECIIAFLLGIMLFAIGFEICFGGIQNFIQSKTVYIDNNLLYLIAIISALISIISKEWMYRFTIKCARKINSSSMEADAWHHRSDAFSSIGSLIGIIGLYFDYSFIDQIACIVISLFIFKAAYEICSNSCEKLIDTSCSNETINKIKTIINANEDVLNIDALKARQYGSKMYIDLEITLDKNMTFEHSHEIAHLIHDNVENKILGVKHCMIHVNPSSISNHHHI